MSEFPVSNEKHLIVESPFIADLITRTKHDTRAVWIKGEKRPQGIAITLNT
ncbi:hypothetical protein A0R60_0158 [Enterobacter asburiae]|nr:hypothetical protein A0R60_0158 [Enterobacter asburiae]